MSGAGGAQKPIYQRKNIIRIKTGFEAK